MKEEEITGYKTPLKPNFFQSNQTSLKNTPITNFQSPLVQPGEANADMFTLRTPDKFYRPAVDSFISPESTLNETPEIRRMKLKTSETSEPLVASIDDHELDLSTDAPALKWCAFCGQETVANKYMKNNSTTFWSSVLIFFMGGFLGCFLLPYATNMCKTAELRCVQCNHAIQN